MTVPSSPIALALKSINEPDYLTSFFVNILYGICVFSYFSQVFPMTKNHIKESLYLRALLTLEFITLTLIVIVLFISEFARMVNHFGEVTPSFQIPMSLRVSFIPAFVISAGSQLYYLKIIAILMQRQVLKIAFASVIISLIVAEFGVTLWDLIKIMQLKTFFDVGPTADSFNNALKATAAIVMTINISLAVTMVGTLWSIQTGFKRTDNFLRQLMLFFVSSGIAAAVLPLLTLVLLSLNNSWSFLPYNIFPFLEFLCLSSIIRHRHNWSRSAVLPSNISYNKNEFSNMSKTDISKSTGSTAFIRSAEPHKIAKIQINVNEFNEKLTFDGTNSYA